LRIRINNSKFAYIDKKFETSLEALSFIIEHKVYQKEWLFKNNYLIIPKNMKLLIVTEEQYENNN